MYFLDEGNSRIARGEKSPLENLDFFRTLELGEVISVDDPNYLGRIKVRIKGTRSRGGDDGILDANLPWCVPMIPKFLSTQPKVSEAVFIFVFGKDKQHADRMFIGPIISQPQQLNFDPFYVTALGGFTFAAETPKVSVATIPELTGVFPNPADISIQGRYNTDITQKNNEIVLRAGKFETVTPSGNNPFPFRFNATTQAYIQIKNDTVIQKQTDKQAEQKGTITNIVANKINLLTHTNGNPRFNLTNQINLISDDEMQTILDEAHQLPFGDILLEYLQLLKDALFLHVHNGNGNQATDLTISGNKQALASFKAKADALENQMLSKNIRIN
jgi:hypothetical protein